MAFDHLLSRSELIVLSLEYLYMFSNIPANHTNITVSGVLGCTGLLFVTFTTAPAEFSTETYWSLKICQ